MRIKSRWLLIGLLLIVMPDTVTAQKSTVAWQSSESAYARLGVRDKNGTLGEYEATFIVTGADKKQYKKAVMVKGDDWGYVTFPDDFQLSQRSGRFSWRCLVRGRVAVSGQFMIGTSEAVRQGHRRQR